MPFTQLVSYGFTTTENPLSAGGTFSTMAGYNNLKVPSSGLCESATTANANEYYNNGTWANNQYSEVTIQSATVSSGPGVRMGATQGYIVAITPGAAAGGGVFKTTGAGAYSAAIATWTGTTMAVNDVWRLAVIGTSFTITQNGITATTFTDSSYASGFPGIYASTSTGGISLFAAGVQVNTITGNNSWLTVALANSLRGVRH